MFRYMHIAVIYCKGLRVRLPTSKANWKQYYYRYECHKSWNQVRVLGMYLVVNANNEEERRGSVKSQSLNSF